jgi:hypothetical protein
VSDVENISFIVFPPLPSDFPSPETSKCSDTGDSPDY